MLKRNAKTSDFNCGSDTLDSKRFVIGGTVYEHRRLTTEWPTTTHASITKVCPTCRSTMVQQEYSIEHPYQPSQIAEKVRRISSGVSICGNTSTLPLSNKRYSGTPD